MNVAPIFPLVAKTDTKNFQASRIASLGKTKTAGPECRNCHLEIHVPANTSDLSDVIRRHRRGLSCKRNGERYRMRQNGLWPCPNKGMMLTKDYLGFDPKTHCQVEQGKYAVYTNETVASFVAWLFANDRKVSRDALADFIKKDDEARRTQLHGLQLEFEIQADQAATANRGY